MVEPITFPTTKEAYPRRLLCTTDIAEDSLQAMLKYSGHRWATPQDLQAAGYVPADELEKLRSTFAKVRRYIENEPDVHNPYLLEISAILDGGARESTFARTEDE